MLSTRYDLTGAPLLATEIVSRLRQRGHTAEAWFLFYNTSRHAAPEPGTRILLPHAPQGAFDFIKMADHLQRAMWEFRPDIFFGVHPLANTLGTVAAYMANCRCRYGGQHNPASSQRRILRVLDKVIGTYLYTGNIAVSRAVKDTYRSYPRRYQEKLFVIYNGIPDPGPTHSKEFARQGFNLPQDCFLVGTVGQQDTEQKNHEFLIELMAYCPDVHLAIAGDGKRRPYLASNVAALQLESRVHFVGSIAVNTVARFLNALDLFLFPSRFEGFGLALVEAMQSGLPVVVNDLPVFRELLRGVDDDYYGLLISTDEPDKWRTAIASLKNDSRLYAHWARQSLRGAARFSLEQMIDAYECVIAGRIDKLKSA